MLLSVDHSSDPAPEESKTPIEIAWTDPEDFGKKNWVDRDDVRTVA